MRSALVVAAQTQGLSGCEGDADLITETLENEGFQVQVVRGRSATRDGILDAYERLIDACSPHDAAVIYFSGHAGANGEDIQEKPSSWFQLTLRTRREAIFAASLLTSSRFCSGG